ncbi:riboflavin kinase/FMN adenylyltransferase [Desulfitispora alkaliphila]|uniref:bifunctional riboflavin kinase/FAD synthetase n=1 Tax=Desulfitispora alkaliphila TaxID=622674 RepID=UPI003D214128
MEVLRSLKEKVDFKRACVALGNFDGLHLGHQELIQMAISRARECNGTPMVYTFDPHPMSILRAGNLPGLIVSTEQKLKMLERMGIKAVVLQEFDESFSRVEADQFVEEMLLQKLDLKRIVVGFNYHFGYKGSGDWKMLQTIGSQNNFGVDVIEPIKYKDEVVSSSKIRKLLIDGDVEYASKLLGYFPILEGPVVHGDKLGRKIGFPTANMDIDSNILIPGRGVYAVKVFIQEKEYIGVLNIGLRPTVTNRSSLRVEVHIPQVKLDLYNKKITVQLFKKIRNEQKFDNLTALVDKINEDINATISFFETEVYSEGFANKVY